MHTCSRFFYASSERCGLRQQTFKVCIMARRLWQPPAMLTRVLLLRAKAIQIGLCLQSPSST